ncbi:MULTISPECIES: tol-pal system protein YbgF [unclassified Rhizobium]|uniref:tol-pal system protein YbgF n=1 Tax=unclassified Rhizobium TaxID=2613769 RepID=UPI0006FEACFA|nr:MULTISPECIES: tol-pal system protein YbgF [unclassified Rhizobium]KQV35137.1 tol-pal system protein [Rhizobium sp. Root1212]KRD24942.1 tol-pal system protein [Rhizobium sp. Root268]
MKHFVVAGMIGLTALAGFGQAATAMPLSAVINRVLHREQPAAKQQPIINVQSSEVGRIGQLEEQIRQLNGRIEEMSFQLLQMQEQIRKFQEDNEFRFQDLESGKSGASTKKSGSLQTPRTNNQASVAPSATDGQATDPNAGLGSDTASSTSGAPPSTLGQIIFDENGNPVAANQDAQPMDNGQASVNPAQTGADQGLNSTPDTQQQTAALDNPGDLYQSAYGHVLSGDYSVAETEFRDYLDVFPNGDKAADANFWLGEAQYSQGKYNDAAKTFLNAHQAFGKSPKAPEMLLKLGMSLAALDNKDTACATLREVTKRYPKASPAVNAKVKSEQSRLAC